MTRYEAPMSQTLPLYTFRDRHFAPAGNTVVSAAPLSRVVKVYGGGGLKGESGLIAAFGGAATFRDEDTGDLYLGVWGKRNTSRFRRQLREAGANIVTIKTPPPGRLVRFTQGERKQQTSGDLT